MPLLSRRCCALVRLALGLAVLVLAPLAVASAAQEQRLLFIGNSLVYTGNLPAVLDALAAANGQRLHSEMLVKAGATLQQRVADGSARAVVERGHYDRLVLQERGGELAGDRDGARVRQSEAAHAALASLARANAASVLLLGTYQDDVRAAERLQRAEASLARRLRLRHVPVALPLLRVRAAAPQGAWLAEDGLHPGADLTLLEAVLLYREIYRAWPAAVGFRVPAPLYAPQTRFDPPRLASDYALQREPAAPSREVSAADMAAVLALLAAPSAGRN